MALPGLEGFAADKSYPRPEFVRHVVIEHETGDVLPSEDDGSVKTSHNQDQTTETPFLMPRDA
jgi:hypothetical protein